MIEIKLLNGAKLGYVGLLSAEKSREQIAKINGVKPDTAILSYPSRSVFHYAKNLIKFVTLLRELSNEKKHWL
ncbi:glutamate synthase-related protein [Flavobacterium sp. ALD4]|jgi:glutamate synthase domain-containing protein 2|uniref:glutamate synthase-related protein n=1 Tax=Flavobacterium sp. ALD4 TaxID=2058314 RepID=UPI001E4C5D6E|nr:glutamate synthase-related protein [Flavobacterium sp. ALD4]